jgi:hypothetical protein
VSYVRFGEQDSDVYVYLDIEGGIECCGCALVDCFNAPTAQAMADHLRRHLAAGHTVPAGVIEDVLANPDLDPAHDRSTRGCMACREPRGHLPHCRGDV